MGKNQQSDTALKPFFADMELRATEEYLKVGRYFADETTESLMLEWNGAIIEMGEGVLGPGLLRAIVGVLGELGLRGVRLPSGAMAEMNDAAMKAFAPLDPEIKRQLLSDLEDRIAASMPDANTLH
jgi:hypothetical protein